MSAPAGHPGWQVSDAARTLERIWHEVIRVRHPDLPRAVIVVASGAEATRVRRWGHWAEARWRMEGVGEIDDQGREVVGEVMVAGERLAHGPVAVLGTLLHEAAHALASYRGIQDTSRQGRYHNKRYRALAVEVGLEVGKDQRFGWCLTEIGPDTQRAYWSELAELEHAIRGHRVELVDDEDEDEDEGGKVDPTLHVCGCPEPRKLRMAPKTMELGAVWCDICGEQFRR